MNYWNEIFRLFFPEHCAACGGELPEGMGLLCPRCRIDMPLTYYWKEHDNPVARKFWGLVPVMEASSFFFFVHGSRYRDLVHGFKYRGQWRSCSLLGRSFGERLRESGLYADVELVVPVPLHFRRLFTRGYNQAEYLAEGIASALGVPVERKTLARGGTINPRPVPEAAKTVGTTCPVSLRSVIRSGSPAGTSCWSMMS